MATMLNVYDRQTRKKTAVLQNAFDIVETHELNQIYLLSFSLPSTDEKNKFCLPRHFVRWGDDGELYRIKAPKTDENNVGVVTYECEHVITTLCDTVMFGSFDTAQYVSNLTTKSTIEWLLSKQQDWVLDVCDFSRKFEYLWEQENILNALYSIPKEFASPYMWTFDTTVYPWKISLRLLDTTKNPQYYLRARSNILSSGTAADYANICTRIYPLGYGEGVNQLNIKDANNGVPYIQSPKAITDKYGIVEKVLVDRRFENAESLKAYAQSMLKVYQEPTMSRTFDVTDLYPLTGQDWVDAEVGKICKMTQDGSIAYITKTQRQHDKAGDLHIDLSTKPTDIASNVADLADRVRIESVYAQGATQLYQHSKDANATTSKGMVMSLYFPSEMRQINKVLMRLKLGKFRSYSQATDSKTVTVKTCSNETVTVKTNPAALGGQKTTSDGGGTTSSSGGTSVSVSGGGSSGNGTDQMTTGLSLDVKVEGLVSAPMATQTSPPSTDTTSGTEWPNASYANVYILTQEKDLIIEDNGGQESLQNGSTEDQSSTLTSGPYDEYGQTERNYTSTPYDYYEDAGSHYHDMRKHTHFLPHSHTISGSVNIYHGHKIKTSSRTGYNAYKYMYHDHAISLGELEHSHNINHYHTVSLGGGASGGYHTHTFSVPNHTHTISAHSHSLPDLSHSHDFKLNGHTHSITLNSHSHDITAGIFESGNPTSFDIYVGGKKKTTVNSMNYDGDITTWLLNDKNQIPRNSWIDVEIRPNDLAYVQCSVFVQGFVQSRGGGNY